MAVTDQQLIDKAKQLYEGCKLLLSGAQADWLGELLYPAKSCLTASARDFLQKIWDGKYTDPCI